MSAGAVTHVLDPDGGAVGVHPVGRDVGDTTAAGVGSGSEAARNADFSTIRYAQCWEDADTLLEALDPRPGAACLSIASAGDNALALLARDPGVVVAVDLNPAQIACLELRVAAYRHLDHAGLLELLGSRPAPGEHRTELYRRCRPHLPAAARNFWDARPGEVAAGAGAAGKFERYFATFRRRVLPLVHPRRRVEELLRGGPPGERAAYYRRHWDTWRWRLLFRLFFSRRVMGRMGRDPAFFNYVEGPVSSRILARAAEALTVLDPADNPYLQWILTGRHTTALPFALRPENFEKIRANLGRLEVHCDSLENYLGRAAGRRRAVAFDAFNLSDIFEYQSEANAAALLDKIAAAGRPGARLAYWNTLVPRSRPASLAARLRPLEGLARELHARDKAFFYSRFVVEEVAGGETMPVVTDPTRK